MKFTCLKENLLRGLNIVTKAIPIKSSLPILSNVLITSKDNVLTLSATNLDTAITVAVAASIDEEGAVTVPAKLLKEFVSHLSSDTIMASSDDYILSVECGGSKSTFNGMSAEDFPALPEMPKNGEFLELDPHLLNSVVSVVAFSAAADDTKPVYSGVLISYNEGDITFASTNGFRLSEKNISLDSSLAPFSVVVPAKILLEVARLFSSIGKPIKFALNYDENLALFESEDVMIATRVFDGKFPDYKRIIPQEYTLRATFSGAELLEAVKLASVFAKELNDAITMQFDTAGYIKLGATSQEIGGNNSELKAVVEGDALEISFNPKYLLDVLTNVKAEEFIFETAGSVAPCVIKTVTEEGYLHIIMPLRIHS